MGSKALLVAGVGLVAAVGFYLVSKKSSADDSGEHSGEGYSIEEIDGVVYRRYYETGEQQYYYLLTNTNPDDIQQYGDIVWISAEGLNAFLVSGNWGATPESEWIEYS